MNILGVIVSFGKAFIECVVRGLFKTFPKVLHSSVKTTQSSVAYFHCMLCSFYSKQKRGLMVCELWNDEMIFPSKWQEQIKRPLRAKLYVVMDVVIVAYQY
jgi:hypothetical protein